ncbi:MAG: hypothetical protein QOC98_2147 [Frankiaceae bacterium]|nr:hypothetical protein [Frankiaceae bacterium]
MLPLIAERLTSQLLSRPSPAGPVAVVAQLLAVQAQDARGFRLAVRARSTADPAPQVTDLEAALNDGSLVVSWLNRGTLHLVRADDFWDLHALTTPQLGAAVTRRLRQEGVGPEQAERGVEVCAQAVAEGPRTRGEMREALDAAGVPTARQALIHVLFAATLAGYLVRGPMRGSEQAFVSAPGWVGSPPPLDRPAALARLARRYLSGHAPADARDLARWAGITLTDARAGFAALVDETCTRDDGLVELRDQEPTVPPMPLSMPPKLLGAFDPLLLGWTSRAEIIGPHTNLVTDNGIFRPFVLVDGRAVGTWGLAGGVVTVTALEPLAPDVEPALQQETAAVLRFLGLPEKPVVFR